MKLGLRQESVSGKPAPEIAVAMEHAQLRIGPCAAVARRVAIHRQPVRGQDDAVFPRRAFRGDERVQHIVDGFTGSFKQAGRLNAGGGIGGLTVQQTWLEPFQSRNLFLPSVSITYILPEAE